MNLIEKVSSFLCFFLIIIKKHLVTIVLTSGFCIMNSIFYFLVPVASSWFEIELFDEVKHKVNNTIHQLLDRMEQELQQGQNGFIYKVIQVGADKKFT